MPRPCRAFYGSRRLDNQHPIFISGRLWLMRRYVQNIINCRFAAAIRVFPSGSRLLAISSGESGKQAHTRMYDRHSGRSTRCTDSRHFNLHRIAIRTRKRPHRSSVSPIGLRLRLPSFPELCKHDRHGRQPHQTARRKDGCCPI